MKSVNVNSDSGFTIQKGINISHWLSQNSCSGNVDLVRFTTKDVDFIKSRGFDHIRIPVDECNLFKEEGDQNDTIFKALHQIVDYCCESDVRIIIDLHSTRSHSFEKDHNLIWKSQSFQEDYINLWGTLSDEFIIYPTNLVAYELLNEPIADLDSMWNLLLNRTIKEIRKDEPFRTIIVGSNNRQSPNKIPALLIPEDDENIIISFHFYTPFLLTHHRASWTSIGPFSGHVNYPGRLIDPMDIRHISDTIIKSEIVKHNGYYSVDVIDSQLTKAVAFANCHNLKLYCGEFGCLPTVNRKFRLAWYADIVKVFTKYSISWAIWDYKGGFSVFTQDGLPDEILLSLLLGP